jgi:hypothetical protein
MVMDMFLDRLGRLSRKWQDIRSLPQRRGRIRRRRQKDSHEGIPVDST